MKKRKDNNFKKNLYLVLGVLIGVIIIFLISSNLDTRDVRLQPEEDDSKPPLGELGDGKSCQGEKGNEGTGVSEYFCVENTAKDGCNDPAPGFCLNGVCCKAGKLCPDGFKECKKEGKSASGICCLESAICRYSKIKGLNYCEATECPGQVRCTATWPLKAAICCDPLPGGKSPCDTQKGIPYCKTSDCEKGNPGFCAKGVCCNDGEICTGDKPLDKPIKICIPKDAGSCEEGEEFCKGSGKFSDVTRCCPAGKFCFRSANGWPGCA